MLLMLVLHGIQKLYSRDNTVFFVQFCDKIFLNKKEQGMGKIILASSSPRRAAILKDYELEIVPSPYVEIHSKTAFSYDYVENLAFNKANAVAKNIKEPALIIGADTVVVLGDQRRRRPSQRVMRAPEGRHLAAARWTVQTGPGVETARPCRLSRRARMATRRAVEASGKWRTA